MEHKRLKLYMGTITPCDFRIAFPTFFEKQTMSAIRKLLKNTIGYSQNADVFTYLDVNLPKLLEEKKEACEKAAYNAEHNMIKINGNWTPRERKLANLSNKKIIEDKKRAKREFDAMKKKIDLYYAMKRG